MTMPSQSTTPANSAFVTVLAWFVIGLASAGLLLFTYFVLGGFDLLVDESQLRIAKPEDAQPVPWIMKFMIGNGQLIMWGLQSSFVLTLVSAIGLLWRKNWARILFIVLIVFAIIWNLGSLALWAMMISAMHGMTGAGAPEMPAVFGTMMSAAMIGGAACTIALCLVFGWIIKRLASPDIRREFGAL